MTSIEFNMVVFKEKNAYVAYCPEMDLSSCGGSVDEAKQMLRTAVRLFLEESEKMGTLDEILLESGYSRDPDGRFDF